MVLGDLTPVEKSLEGEEILLQTTDPFITNAIVDDRTRILLQKISISERSTEEIRELEALLDEYNDVFALYDEELGQTPAVQHKIELTDSRPIRVARRPIPFALREQVAKMVDDYLQRGVIQLSSSPYSSPVTIVKKKDGSLRFCVDYRRLNAVTKKDAYPVPDIDSMLLSFGKRKYFSSLDLLSGYWQVKMDPTSMEKTAFPTEQGLFEFTVMPFGLTNAPATFERLIECIMRGYIGNFVYVYLDDVLVASESWTDHIDHLRKVFQRLRENRLKLKPSKCKILAEQIEFLGHKLTGDGLKMNEEKIKAIKDFPKPQNVRELQRFLGLAGYYRKFIRGFAMIARPLHNLCGKATWEWSEESQTAFEMLIVKICEDVTLKLPDFQAARDDPNRPFLIQTDASKLV